jgi:hypothetical protein
MYQANICNPPPARPPGFLFPPLMVDQKSLTLSTIPGKFKVTYELSEPSRFDDDVYRRGIELQWDVLSDKNNAESSVKRDLTTVTFVINPHCHI